MYESAIEVLAAAGLNQYEISNFSRPGFQSLHNLRYWQRRPYLGLGLDASSMLRAAIEERDTEDLGYVLRSSNTDDLTAYLAGENQPETAWLSPVSQHEEAWFLGLRLNAGVQVAELECEFGARDVAAALHVVRELEKDELLTIANGRIRLTPRGQLLSNEVFQQFLGLAPDGELTTLKQR